MDKIYEAAGTLSRNFVGQISYTVCLDKKYSEMDIVFSFDKQHYSDIDITDELKKEVVEDCRGKYDDKISSDEAVLDAIRGMKTEIHIIATMNDMFIGGVHKQLATRHMYFSQSRASDGCIPQKSIGGVIKVTLVVFNVLLDDTHYALSLSAD